MTYYQSGGLAQANEEEEQVDPTTGLLSALAAPYQTSPEAQNRAREILDQLMAEDAFAGEEEILEQFKETAEQSRQALRDARERLLADKYDPRQAWLAAAQAFGSPTRTGQFGETIGNLAGALREPFAERDEFRRSRDAQLLELEQALTGVDEGLLSNRFKLAEMQRKQLGTLGKEALKTLGKTLGKTPPQTAGVKSLDQKMATELSKWQLQGAADAAKSIAEMTGAVEALGESDKISGPLIGLMPKQLRDIAVPISGDVQDTIEQTAQRSLKAVLGGQFGQREGEMLLERTFNPRLDEKVNRQRAFRLLKMLEEATAAKNAALVYFQENGTMQGFRGKTTWTIEDFQPEPIMITVKMPDGGTFDIPEGTTQGEAQRLYREYRQAESGKPEKKFRGGRVRGYPRKRKSPQFHIKHYAEGGVVDFEELEDDTEMDVDLQDMLLALTGGVAGGAAGAGSAGGVSRLEEMARGMTRGTPGERKVAEAMEVSGIDPEEAMLDVRRGQRMGVPQRPIDVSGRMPRVLGEQAMMAGGEEAEQALAGLEERHAGSRARVGQQVEQKMRVPEFFDTEEKLTERLYARAKPLYQQAYKENPSVKEPKVLKEIFEAPDGKKAVAIALRIMQNQGKTIGKADAVGLVRNPSLEFLDNLKKGLDTVIRQTDQKAGGPNPLSHSIKELRSKLITFLDNPDNVTPTYGKARAQYKGDLEILQALDMGKGEFLRMPSELARRELGNMSWAERNALRTGVAQKLYETIYGPTTDIAAARRIIGSPEMAKRLELTFDKPKEFRIFQAALEREMDMFEQGKKTLRRAESGRERRLTEDMLSMDDPLATVKEKFGRGPVAWAMKFLPSFGGRKKIELSKKEADEIVRILNTKDPKELEALGTRLGEVQKRGKKLRGRKGKAALVGTAIGAALAPFLDDEGEESDVVELSELEE